MTTKVHQEVSVEKIKKDLQELKGKSDKTAIDKAKEIAKICASMKQWPLAMEAIQNMQEKNERNLLIADLIEEYLIPLKDITQAKNFAKSLTPEPELQPLVYIRIALSENNINEARKLAEKLPSPLSRNFALVHIMEHCLEKNDQGTARQIGKELLDNVRTIYDLKSKSSILRELALNLYMAHNEKEQALEAASHIPNEAIKAQVMDKIKKAK